MKEIWNDSYGIEANKYVYNTHYTFYIFLKEKEYYN